MNWVKKCVLVTGGAGFLGSCIAEKLVKENAEVTILDNFSVGKLENIPVPLKSEGRATSASIASAFSVASVKVLICSQAFFRSS